MKLTGTVECQDAKAGDGNICCLGSTMEAIISDASCFLGEYIDCRVILILQV